MADRTVPLRLGVIASLAACALAAAPHPAAGQDCDIPLHVQVTGVLPNVMILLDSSTSMREAIYHQDYDRNTAWSGWFDARGIYTVTEDGLYAPNAWDASLPTTPLAPLVSSEVDEPGTYSGNYLNWIFFHATDEQRTQLPQTTRIEVAKAAMSAIVTQVDGVRWGITKFNGDNGGTIVSGVSASQKAFLSQIDGIKSDAWSPAAEAMVDLIRYFQNDSATSAPIQYDCQENYVIFISDGWPTEDYDLPHWIGDQDGDGNEPGSCTSIGAPLPDSYDCSDYLDDVAYYLAHTDMRPDLRGEQVVRTYTVQLSEEVPLLVDTAANGLGQHYFARDLEALLTSLNAIVTQIRRGISSATTAAAVSGEQYGSGRLFRAKFLPGQWHGFLESFSLPYSDGSAPLWEAGELLASRSASSRNILTRVGGVTREFLPGDADEFVVPMALPDAVTTEQVMRYVRGEPVEGFRDREGWKLGDVVNSSPLVVGPPAAFVFEAGYQEFLVNYQNRAPMVYVGANDGMLHAFSVATGEELWAYIPASILPNLQSLTSTTRCHSAYVDLTPTAYDVRVGGVWRTLLLGGLRKGGDAYFAIDVTNPTSPEVLWETRVPELLRSYSRPTLVRGRSRSYLWLGSGPDLGGQASVAVLDPQTGELLFTAAVGGLHTDLNMASDATGFDADWDGATDFVYQGDLAGNLWKWDVRAADPTAWTGQRLFSAGEPIQAPPALSTDPDGNLRIYFGTGRYLAGSDLRTSNPNRFYCVIDDGSTVGLDPSSLVDQTDSVTELVSAHGWYMNLEQAPGERVTQPALVVAGVVYFTSFGLSGSGCALDYRAWLYHVDYLNGSHPDESDDGTDRRVESIGDGVASAVVPLLQSEEILVQTSDTRVSVRDMWGSPNLVRVRAWREVFDR